jgi:hypothetical protein
MQILVAVPQIFVFKLTIYKYEYILKGHSHEKVGEMSVWGISLGPN